MDFLSLLMGGGVPSEDFKEIVKLHELLEEANIPHTFVPFMGGYMLRYFGKNEFSEENATGIAKGVVCSVIEHMGSYGHEKDLLEIQGLHKENETGSVIGYLTAEDVFERILSDYEK